MYGCSPAVQQNNIAIQADEMGVYIPVTIADTTIMMLWDTGSQSSVLSASLADKLGIEYDTTKKISGLIFSSSNTDPDHFIPPYGLITGYISDKIKFKIENKFYTFQPVIFPNFQVDAVLGNDFMNQYYHAVHLTDKRLSLSTTPISFASYDIVDSVTFCGHRDNDLQIYTVKIENNFLNLVLDSGLISRDRNESTSPYIYWDIVLTAKDSTDIALKVFNDIKGRARVNLSYFIGKTETYAVYDSVFSIGSYKTQSYISCRIDSTFKDSSNGYIAYGYIARFDIAYYNPQTNTMKLYKIKDYKSIMRDVSIWEYVKGVKIIQE